MTQLREIRAAQPFALSSDDGERIWFMDVAITVKASAATTGGELGLIEAIAPPGYGPPLHVHHDEHEAFYLLDGALEVACGPERYRAEAGAFAFLPRGIAHGFRVVSETPARFLAFAVPGGHETFFAEVGGPAEGPGLPPRVQPDIARLAQIAARYNVEIVGPPIDATTANGAEGVVS